MTTLLGAPGVWFCGVWGDFGAGALGARRRRAAGGEGSTRREQAAVCRRVARRQAELYAPLLCRRLEHMPAPPTPKIWNRGLTGLALGVWVWVGSHTNWTGVVGCASSIL